MSRLASVLLLALPGLASAGPIVTDTFSSAATTASGQWSYKLNTYVPSTDVRLVDFAPWLDPSGASDEVRFVVYERTGTNWLGTEEWALRWDSGAQAISGGAGFKSSPAVDLDLQSGRSYALGFYLLGNTVGYGYDSPGHEIVSWGRRDGVVFATNYTVFWVLDPIVKNRDNPGYHQQVTVEIYQDLDGDGYDERYDCDDTDPEIHPSAPERCNGIDDDCDGIVDENVVYFDYWLDADGDGFGDPAVSESSCDGPPPGHVSNDDDCDDTNASVYPGAPELCDGLDNDCDGVVDNDVVYVDWYRDGDGDGFGVDDDPVATCDGPPDGYAAEAGDCDDTDPDVHPGAPERCNGLDDDCDGVIDEDVVFVDYHADRDMDGFGDPDEVIATCDGAPPGYVADGTDCDDGNSSVYPGAPELCDGLDNDCDGVVPDDEGDSDGDGWRDCEDCGPDDPTIHPGAVDLCDGVDRSCDGNAPTAEECDPWLVEDLKAGGCGCQAAPVPSSGLWLLLPLVLVRRRRG